MEGVIEKANNKTIIVYRWTLIIELGNVAVKIEYY